MVARITEIAMEYIEKSYTPSHEMWPEPTAIHELEKRWLVGFTYKQRMMPTGPTVIIEKADMSCSMAPMR